VRHQQHGLAVVHRAQQLQPALDPVHHRALVLGAGWRFVPALGHVARG
jgi:hypothetical protein